MTTPELLAHRLRVVPAGMQRRHWVAAEAGAVVGVATAYLRSWSNELDVGQIHLGVRSDSRRRGIGSKLLETAERHLDASGARRFRVRAARGSSGTRFAAARGYSHAVVSEVLWSLDVAETDLRELPELEGRAAAEGFALLPLRERRDSAPELFDFFVAAGGLAPGSPIGFEDWREVILHNPALDFDGSFLVALGARPVALAWLLVDHERGRGENEWTATLPKLRGRGLARLAKLAAIRWAAANGIHELKTENDVDNAPMLALNRRLGYREVAIRDDLERSGYG